MPDRTSRALVAGAVTVLFALRPVSFARAHGDPPEALGAVASDADGASLVRLNEGLALRTAEGFRYLCPALWEEDAIVPADSIPGGPAVIGAASGLWLVSAQGSVSRHPDPAAAGRVLALAASAGGLFALLQSGDLYQVLRVEAERVAVLFGGTQPWDDLAASERSLQLVRLLSGHVYEQRLSLTGDAIAQDDAAVAADAAAVFARLAGDVGYAIVLRSSLAAELGRIEDGSWRSLRTGHVLAGPVETAAGERFVAVDGELARFDDEVGQPLDEPASVTCLRRHFELAYACSDRGLRALSPSGLGDSLFELADLGPPDLAQIPRDQRDACWLQWQRYEVDLRSVGIMPRAPDSADGGAPDAGARPAGERPDAGAPSDAGDAGERPRRRNEDDGCSVVLIRGGDACGPSLVTLALLLLARRRRHE